MLLVSAFSFGQKKYIKKNRKEPELFYGDSSTYARGLWNDSVRMFVGNHNGAIYYYNLQSGKTQLIFKMPNVDEIRDIERSGNAILAMHSGEDGKLAIIQLDGGMKLLALPEWKGIFFDGLDVLGKRAFLMGDPLDGYFSLFHSGDGGQSWSACSGKVPAREREAGFAASGTNVQILNDSTYVFVSGGMASRFFKSTDRGASWSDIDLPYYPGESIGGYSLCFADDSNGVIVGGDYKDIALGMNSCFYTKDGGESWYNAMKTVRGYRSCVYYKSGVFYACGTNGIDFSVDGGKEWIPFADGNYFTLSSTETQLIATTVKGHFQLFDLIELKE
jgi:hypothetical protein